MPVIVGDAVNQFIDNSLDKLQSRFSIDEDDERFRFDHEIAPVINIGEIAAIDDYGGIVRHGTLNSSTTPVGTVMSKTRNGKSVYVKPFNKIIDKGQIHSCMLEEEFFTALSLRVHYIENNIDITDRMNKKNI